MSSNYEAPDPRFAELVYRTNQESDLQTERLEHASTGELRSVARNQSESTIARGTALLGLMRARDPELANLMLDLFDDTDQELWRMSVGACLKDSRIQAKLLSLLDDPDENNWSEAAGMLARSGHESLLPRFVSWLNEGDEVHRNVAVECLKSLKTLSAQDALYDYWTRVQADHETRLIVAAALFEMGNPCGQELLDSVARRGEGNWSVFAATSFYFTQPLDGLRYMLQILDNGDLEARQAMVNQIWNFAHLPHAFTADGLSEARVWVENELKNLVT